MALDRSFDEESLHIWPGPSALLRWRRCVCCGAVLTDEEQQRSGFDSACLAWALARPIQARRVRAQVLAHDRELLSLARDARSGSDGHEPGPPLLGAAPV